MPYRKPRQVEEEEYDEYDNTSLPQRVQSRYRDDQRYSVPLREHRGQGGGSFVSHTNVAPIANDDRQKTHTNAIRLRDPQQYVMRNGNRQIVVHTEPIPVQNGRRSGPSPRVFLFGVAIGVVLAALVVILWNASTAAIQQNQINSTYGMPRTFQLDAVVGHNDSAGNPSHFLVQNLHGIILVTEYPGGDASKAHLYKIGRILLANADQVPVTISFQDVNGDGKLDMIVQVGTGTNTTSSSSYLNNGTIFVVPS